MESMQEPRAEALIAEIYRLKSEFCAQGKFPAFVVLPMAYIVRLRLYQQLIGKLEHQIQDYMNYHSIFGLEFMVGSSNTIELRCQD